VNDFHARPIDTSRPTAARLYDWYLGGTHNYKIDRATGGLMLEVCPILRTLAFQNRAFLRRAVTAAVRDHGIRQFIDIGSGIPTEGNVHQVAQQIDPTCRVVYVDNDDEAVVTSRKMLEGNTTAVCIDGDFTMPETVLDHEDTLRLIDFSQPTALLVVALLHFIGDQHQPRATLRTFIDKLAPGSLFIASHVAVDEADETNRQFLLNAERMYGNTANPGTIRTRAQFTEFFDGLDLVDPGVAFAADWNPDEPIAEDDQPARRCLYAAAGRKP
jgi:hypothetical protein